MNFECSRIEIDFPRTLTYTRTHSSESIKEKKFLIIFYFSYSIQPIEDKPPLVSTLIDNFSRTSIDSDNSSPIIPNRTIDYLNIVRQKSNNAQCADCDCENPTVAIMSWLLIICKKCAGKHIKTFFLSSFLLIIFCFIQLFIN